MMAYFIRRSQRRKQIFNQYRSEGGKLKKREFNEAVGKAMRNGSDDKHIQGAANAFRREVYDPIKKEAISVKLLPEDVEVATAEQYLNRVWNKEKITRKMPEFVDKVSKWLMDQDEIKQAQRVDEIDQDFKVKVKEKVRVKETGEVAEVDIDADTLWRRTTKRRNMMEVLRECLNA